MKLRDRGVSASLPRRARVCVLGVSTLLALAVSPAAFAASQEAGQYRFEAFVPGAEDLRLPSELRAQAGRTSEAPADLLATDRAVEIEWVGREAPGLRGYRLTAMIDGGPLSGVAARWTVAPGSGEGGPLPGTRLYRLRLPLPVDGRLRLHAALEAVQQDGSAVLLAVRHSTPARSAGDPALSGPGWSGVFPAPSGTSALLPSGPAASPASCEAGVPEMRSERSLAERGVFVSGDAACPGRPRGPPVRG